MRTKLAIAVSDHGSRDVGMGVFGVGTPCVCGGVRRQQAGEFQGDDHEDGMGQSPLVAARRREAARRHASQLGNRSGHAECPVPARIHQGHLMPGTEVVIDGYQAKDGSHRANGRDLTLPDGRQLFLGSSGTGAPYELTAIKQNISGQNSCGRASSYAIAAGSHIRQDWNVSSGFLRTGWQNSSWSIGLHESQYAYSIIESIHVWTMASVFRLDRDVRPAPARFDHAQGAGIGGRLTACCRGP